MIMRYFTQVNATTMNQLFLNTQELAKIPRLVNLRIFMSLIVNFVVGHIGSGTNPMREILLFVGDGQGDCSASVANNLVLQ